jgi:Fe-S-cluster-containing hydrogenase component 2
MLAPERAAWYRTIRQLPLFDGLPNEELEAAIAGGDLDLRVFFRDDVVADEAAVGREGSRIFLVTRGQIAIAVLDPEVLADETRGSAGLSLDDKRKRIRTTLPLIRRADKNLATFVEGELWNTAALPGMGDGERSGERRAAAFYAVEPSEVISVAPGRMAHLTARYPFFAERLRRAVDVARGRLGGIQGIKQEIFDFYIRHGLSVAETLRVRQVDKCIECKECERACEARYGHKRLAIKGPRLGMLDFVYACRTCTDQRCIDPCNYDSIRFDESTREVLIDESSCTGCGACAQACPYGSIEMVDLLERRERKLALRLDRAGALQWGEGTRRKAQITRIASKCDHCAGYSDQACISHCPTGALIEIRPTDVFNDGGDLARNGARAGFEHTVIFDAHALLPEAPFRKGLDIQDFGAARVKRSRLPRALMWFVLLLGLLAAFAEILLRRTWPAYSLQFALLRLSGEDPGIALLHVGYKPGCDLAVVLGYTGTSLLVVTLLYPLRKRLRILQRIASSAAWFDLHLMGGILGPLYLTLHSSLKLDDWVSIPYWSMNIVVLSGLVGRYLNTQIPELLHGQELEELENERELAQLRAAHPAAGTALQLALDGYRVRVGHVAEQVGMTGSILHALGDDLARPFRRMGLGLAMRRARAPRRARATMARLADQLMLATRRRLLVPRTQSALHAWKRVHVPFSVILACTAVVHIAMALAHSM